MVSPVIILIGVVYPYCLLFKMNLLKMQFHLDSSRGYPFVFEICLATTGVAFLSALASVGALFYFICLSVLSAIR